MQFRTLDDHLILSIKEKNLEQLKLCIEKKADIHKKNSLKINLFWCGESDNLAKNLSKSNCFQTLSRVVSFSVAIVFNRSFNAVSFILSSLLKMVQFLWWQRWGISN